jgi:sec-independent protein translocase protein TatA
MSGGEIVVIILAIIMVFGTKRIPEIVRGLAKGLGEIKKATDEIKKEITDTDIGKEINDINKQLKG